MGRSLSAFPFRIPYPLYSISNYILYSFGRTDDWIRRFKSLVVSNLKSCEMVEKELISKAASEDRIKVAILDSGIDMTHISIRARKKRIKDIRTWTCGYSGAKAKGGDKSGHGTHIAGIILDLAPNVDIYIAQVTEGRELDDTRSISQVDVESYARNSQTNILTRNRRWNIRSRLGTWT